MTDLKRYLIGAGGWAYFQVPGEDSLKAYSKAFNFVEVNSTFYEVPSSSQVESWRRRVPRDFEFTVRCHRDLTHKYKLEPIDKSYQVLNEMLDICKTLEADMLHIQTPPTFKFTGSRIQSIRDFLSSVNLGGARIAWEVRQAKSRPLPPQLSSLMREFNIIHCVDLSKENPTYESDVLYTRLFGKGKHNIYQFTDEELQDMDKKSAKTDYEKVILSFHGVRMYKDAARLKTYRQTGKFPPVTRSVGLSSLKEVLGEDAEFPATRQQLIERQGWKIIDLTPTKRVRASEMLQQLRDRTYRSIRDIVAAIGDKHGRD